MTWIWVRRRTGTIFVFLTFTLTILSGITAQEPPPKPTNTPPKEGTGGGGAGGGAGGGGEIIMNSTTQYTNYSDLTSFENGVNWDFMGSWTKLDLEKLDEKERPLPLVPGEKGQSVFMCQTSKIVPCILTKSFPPLHNATFSINYYAKSPKGELEMTVQVKTPNKTETFFNYTRPDEGTHEEGKWGTDTLQMPSLASHGDFEIVVSVKHTEEGVWAVSEISLEGLTGPPITTTPAPPIVGPPSTNVTNVTTIAPEQNVTMATQPPKGNGTVAPPPVIGGGGDGGDDMSRLESVAKAVWDAFYVFLALFCACLVALVALIIHGRCKNDEPPPAVATYNPRTASYRMDKVYDNPSYDNNVV